MKLCAFIFFLIAFIFALPCIGQEASSSQPSAQTVRNEYIGLRIANSVPVGKSLPDDLKLDGHFSIASKVGENIPLDFGIRKVSKGKMKMFWLERVAERDAKTKRVLQWEVLDVLVLPQISKNQYLAIWFCFIGKEYEPEVFAIFKYQDKKYLTRARRAWRANRLSRKFEEISVRSVKCENEDWYWK